MKLRKDFTAQLASDDGFHESIELLRGLLRSSEKKEDGDLQLHVEEGSACLLPLDIASTYEVVHQICTSHQLLPQKIGHFDCLLLGGLQQSNVLF